MAFPGVSVGQGHVLHLPRLAISPRPFLLLLENLADFEAVAPTRQGRCLLAQKDLTNGSPDDSVLLWTPRAANLHKRVISYRADLLLPLPCLRLLPPAHVAPLSCTPLVPFWSPPHPQPLQPHFLAPRTRYALLGLEPHAPKTDTRRPHRAALTQAFAQSALLRGLSSTAFLTKFGSSHHLLGAAT